MLKTWSCFQGQSHRIENLVHRNTPMQIPPRKCVYRHVIHKVQGAMGGRRSNEKCMESSKPIQCSLCTKNNKSHLISSHIVSQSQSPSHLMMPYNITSSFSYLIFKKHKSLDHQAFVVLRKKLPSSSSRWLLSTLMCTMEMVPKLLHLGRVEKSAGVSADFFRCLETDVFFLRAVTFLLQVFGYKVPLKRVQYNHIIIKIGI